MEGKDDQKESQSYSITASVNNRLNKLSTLATFDGNEKKYQEEITQFKKRCKQETLKIEHYCQKESRELERIIQEEIMRIKKICWEETRRFDKMSQDKIIKLGIRYPEEIIKMKKICQENITEFDKMYQEGIIIIKDAGQGEIRKIEKMCQEKISKFEKANKDEIQIWERYQENIIMIEQGFNEEKMNDLRTRVVLLDQEVALSRDNNNIIIEKFRQLEESIYELKHDKDKKINEIKVKIESFEPEKKIQEEILEQMLSHMTYLRKDQFKMKENMLELVETCQQFELSLHQSKKRSENLCNHLKPLDKYVGYHTYCTSDDHDKTCTSQEKKFIKEIENKHNEVEEVSTLTSEEAGLPEEDVIILS